MSGRLFAIAVLFVLLSGCAAWPFAKDERIGWNTMIRVKHGEIGGATAWFNLTSARKVGYAFEVGDDGVADACFIKQGGEEYWQNGPPSKMPYSVPDEFGCAYAKASEEVHVTLGPGAYFFGLRGHDCPNLDCSIHYGLDAPSNATFYW